jgi:hypothetical protein
VPSCDMKKLSFLLLFILLLILVPSPTGQTFREILNQKILETASKNPPYVWSWSNKADCSGQMYQIYTKAGVPVPRTDYEKLFNQILDRIRKLLEEEAKRKSLV